MRSSEIRLEEIQNYPAIFGMLAIAGCTSWLLLVDSFPCHAHLASSSSGFAN
ncbi:hypothetical protein OROGR_012482 [Orobanche gracilis]